MSKKQKQPDPIFARIAEYRDAERKLGKAIAAQDRLSARLNAREDDRAKAEQRKLTDEHPALYVAHAYPIYGRHNARKHAARHLHEAGIGLGPKAQAKLRKLVPFAAKELGAMYDAFQVEHARKRRSAGIEAADRALAKAHDEDQRAMRRLVTTRPRTAAGAKALAAVLAETFAHTEPEMLRAIESLARSVQ